MLRLLDPIAHVGKLKDFTGKFDLTYSEKKDLKQKYGARSSLTAIKHQTALFTLSA